ncbi:MAG: hypothetical protein HY271_09085 [Deltaproteobacteria bacterium]|nr:hypothetical protein [Deltaproteobacteria bacterium]
MARRGAGRGSGGWWVVAMLSAGALALWWWMSARRVEAPAPPSSVPGARSLQGAPPASDGSRGEEGEEITPPEKDELERVLREHGSAAGRE